MGDPGLASKAVEMQQDDVTERYHRKPSPPRDLDLARVEQQLRECRNLRYRDYLQRAQRALLETQRKAKR